uniref:Ficolin-1-like n=1 Tax=Phallusia mammillata TaxID=59560 RepID=A0A6F9DCX4_9ASCI|nr:ficolin-1-like [Phallusia mammillata]
MFVFYCYDLVCAKLYTERSFKYSVYDKVSRQGHLVYGFVIPVLSATTGLVKVEMSTADTGFGGTCSPTGHSDSYLLLQSQTSSQRSQKRVSSCKTLKDWGLKSALQVVLCVFALIALFLITTALFLIYSTKSDDRASPHFKFESNKMSPTSSFTSQTEGATSTPCRIHIASTTQSLGLVTTHQPNAEPRSCNYPSHEFPTSCQDVRKQTNTSGVFTIYPFRDDVYKALGVYCDQMTDGGNWMVIQRRVDNLVNFQRNWAWYKSGFGDLSGNFWLGLENLHKLTINRNYELRIDMIDFDNVQTYHVTYRHFSISTEATNYTLNVAGFSGTPSDGLRYHSGKPFSTYDRDNDQLNGHCAKGHKSGWWHGGGTYCLSSNLNGIYQTSRSYTWSGIVWPKHHSLKRVEMKIRT